MIVLVVFGFMFYKLASSYDKSPWIWALVGAGSYILIQLLVGFIIGALYGLELIPVMSEIVVNIIAIGISSGLVYFGYRFLKNKWDAEDTRFDSHQINEIGKNPE